MRSIIGILVLVLALAPAGCDGSPVAPGGAEGERASATQTSSGEHGANGGEEGGPANGGATQGEGEGDEDSAWEERAKSQIERAGRLLARAKELAGPEPRPEVAEALARAERLLASARQAFAEGSYREAAVLARDSSALSSRVISHLEGANDGGSDAEAVAWEAILQAGRYLVQAKELAGPEPRPEVAEVLARAERLLASARQAFGEEQYREALERARESSAYSRRAISALTGSGDQGSDAQAVASDAIQEAGRALARAKQLAGPEPRPEIAEVLARAERLLASARLAFTEGRYREAVERARESTAYSRRVISALS